MNKLNKNRTKLEKFLNQWEIEHKIWLDKINDDYGYKAYKTY